MATDTSNPTSPVTGETPAPSISDPLGTTATATSDPLGTTAPMPDPLASTVKAAPDPSATAPTDSAPPAPAPPRDTTRRRATSDVSAPLALGLTLPLYGASVLVARAMPRGVREVLLERGWVCHAILLLSCLALTILALKAAGLRAQRRVLARGVLPPGDPRITPENVGLVIEYIEVVRDELATRRGPRSFLVERTLRILEHYASRRDVSEAAAANNAEADADAAAVASSFSIVKVLIWAIPILGFIGTVIGIGDAVGGFSRSLEGAGQLDAIKTSLGDVTSGLAVAFDSTLVALVASIFVMMPMSWLQKAEDQLLNDVDDHAVSQVLRRLAGSAEPLPATMSATQPAQKRITAAEVRTLIAEVLAPPLHDVLAANSRLLARITEDREVATLAQTAMLEQLAAFAAGSASLGTSVAGAVAQLERAVTQLDRTTATSRETTTQLLAAGVGLAARLADDKDSLVAAHGSLQDSVSALTVSSRRMATGIDRAATQLERASALAERVTSIVGPSVEKAVTGLQHATSVAEQATAAAERASTATERTHDQLSRELGASRQLLSLLAAGMGGLSLDPTQPPTRRGNGSTGAIGASGTNGANGTNGGPAAHREQT